MRIDSSGNVGIGETNPDASLHITSNTPIISFDESDVSQEYRIGSFGGAFAIYDSTDSAYRVVVDGNGNVGIGVTPESWYASFTALQIGGNGTIYSDTTSGVSTNMIVGQNIYNGSGSDLRITTDAASRHRQVNGTHIFQVAPSGTANNAISWTTAMTIARNGITATNIQNKWTYTQNNTGTNIGHPILMADLADQLDGAGAMSNCYAEITVVTTGTGTSDMFCKYLYQNNSGNDSASLTHIRGNSGSNSNRPYMTLNGQVPEWKMAHPTNYVVRVVVELATRDDLA